MDKIFTATSLTITGSRREKARATAVSVMSSMDKIICNRCGELVFRRNLKLENLQKYDLSNKQAYIESIVNIDGVPFEVAESWASHGMFELCKEKVRCCPECGNQLKTWRAKLCLNCGASFEPLPYANS